MSEIEDVHDQHRHHRPIGLIEWVNRVIGWWVEMRVCMSEIETMY